MLNKRSDKLELIRIAEAVANEKSIDKELVISSMETAIKKAAKTRFGSDNEIKATIDRDTGEINLHKVLVIVDKPENLNLEISLEDAIKKEKKEDLKSGDEIFEKLPPVDFGRIAAQTAKQVITQSVREAERERQYNEFKDKVGEILSGIVKRLEYGNVIIDLNRSEAIIRAHPQFMAKLFFQEVPEIYDGIIEIKSSARDPGSRAKICVHSKDSSIDPVGACVGMRGSRVQAVVNELQGEKIDIVNWSEDPATLAVSALSPAEIQKVIIDDENKRLEVILTEENLSKAIGRRGQNVRLASKLMNYEIDILTDKEESEKRQIEFKNKSENFIKNLELDETLGQLLVAEGFSSIEEINQSTIEEIVKIDGIEEETAKELKERSEEYLKKESEELSKKLQDLGVEEGLINLKGLTPGMLVTLGEKNIKKLKDFAELASDELIGGYDEIKGERIKMEGYLEEFALTKKEADDLIMSARGIVF